MESAASQQWYLRKHEDGTIFGPMSFEQLSSWAWNAQIAPHDAISSDQVTWMKAPMLPDLAMDWLVEVTTERYYGPTTLGAVHSNTFDPPGDPRPGNDWVLILDKTTK